MNNLKKLARNILTVNALSVLGPLQYAKYVYLFLFYLPRALVSRNLNALDRQMAKSSTHFRFRKRPVFFDCTYCDRSAPEGSSAFGLVRELYIRDCYFKLHSVKTFESAKIVVDLGANRGAFSVIRSADADFLLCVEASSNYVDIIRHNLLGNNCKHFAIESVLVGQGGKLAERDGTPRVSLEDLFARHSLTKIDFVKMDIEGSEFELFRNCEWLKLVNALSVEVHPEHGDIHEILGSLSAHNFVCTLADENLNRVEAPESATFIAAWKQSVTVPLEVAK